VVYTRACIATAWTLCAVFEMTACTSAPSRWNHGLNATVQDITRVQDLRGGVDKRCLSSENIRQNVPVAVVSYKQGRIPHYVAIPLDGRLDIVTHARFAMRPQSCELNPGD
jgi:hypothetical protein